MSLLRIVRCVLKYAADCSLAIALKKAYTRTPQSQLRFKTVNNFHTVFRLVENAATRPQARKIEGATGYV